MHTTSLTLLESLRQPGDQEAWLRFVRLYTPLLFHCALRAGLHQSDAEDLVQDVFELLLRKLPDFNYEHGGSFRSWLRVVVRNKWRERQRRAAVIPLAGADRLDEVAAIDDVGLYEDLEYRQHLVKRAMQLIRPEFSDTTWSAFQAHVIAGQDAAVAAADLGIRLGTVYAAKSRVLTRLRRELHGLLD